MKIGFDIGGVISKYPDECRWLVNALLNKDYPEEIYVISDMHPIEKIHAVLDANGFGVLSAYPKRIHSANYEKYGNAAKAILIKELGLDIFIDDFDGYLQWDSSLGPQPLLLKVQSDMFKPYWHESWISDGGEFGRRKYAIPNA